MPKVSVIVPVYGVEKYIERCARSLFEQTLDDIEYLFIDDCTPDRSVEILRSVMEEYPQRKDQVIIHLMEKNSGQAAVRKWGIQNASGEYVIHCDSDDWVDTKMYEKLWLKAKEGNYDIVRCNFCRTDGKNKALCRQIPSLAYDDKLKLMSYLLIGYSLTSLCDKLVRRDIFTANDIIFPVDNMQEDAVLVLQFLYYSNKICFVPELLYFYYRNPTSISQKKTVESYLKNLNEVKNNTTIIIEFLKDKGILDRFSEELVCRKYNVRSHINCLTSQKEFKKMWWSIYPEINWKILFNTKMYYKEKLEYLSVVFGLYKFLFQH